MLDLYKCFSASEISIKKIPCKMKQADNTLAVVIFRSLKLIAAFFFFKKRKSFTPVLFLS